MKHNWMVHPNCPDVSYCKVCSRNRSEETETEDCSGENKVKYPFGDVAKVKPKKARKR